VSIYREFWAALDARDWARFGATVTDDVVATWPQTRETVRGRDALIRFMAEYPGDWHLRVEQEHGDATGGATRIAFTVGGETVPGLTFFTTAGDGRIASFVEFWPEPYEPPADRAHLLERY
jgi:ketosteroid isomerase-like protein